MYVAEKIALTLGRRPILADVDLTLEPGTVTVLVGPNGAGKSSLLQIMAGGRRPTGGRVMLHGRDLTAWTTRDLAATRAVLSQSVNLAFAFTTDEVVRMGLPPTMQPGRADELVTESVRLVGIEGERWRDCTTLSGGEQQRAHLARVLVQIRATAGDGHARYLLLDEPTKGLDLAYQLLVLDIARGHADAGGGVLAVLHDLNLAAVAADRIVVLDRGRILADGPPNAVITDALLSEVYRVELKVSTVASRSFVLPLRG